MAVPDAAGLAFPPVLERQRGTAGLWALPCSYKKPRSRSGPILGDAHWEAGEDGAAAGGFRADVCSWHLWGSCGGGLRSWVGHWGQVDGSAVSLREHGRAGRCLTSSVPSCLVLARAGGFPGDGANHFTFSNTPPSASREGLVS